MSLISLPRPKAVKPEGNIKRSHSLQPKPPREPSSLTLQHPDSNQMGYQLYGVTVETAFEDMFQMVVCL